MTEKELQLNFSLHSEDVNWRKHCSGLCEYAIIGDYVVYRDLNQDNYTVTFDNVVSDWRVDLKKELDVAVLMQDRCSKREAEDYLKRGTIIYTDPQEWIDGLKDNDCYNGQTIEDIKAGQTYLEPVEYEEKTYYVEYCD